MRSSEPRASAVDTMVYRRADTHGKLRKRSRHIGAQQPKAVHSKLLTQTGNTSEARQGGRLGTAMW